jgi:class 3 adenylate cyclase
MALLGAATSVGDVRHVARAAELMHADRRPAAILFADLEASSKLSRTLSTAEYFSLARRLVRAADEAVVDAGGLVGRHLGDGVTAFFLVESLGGESAAARACIEVSRSLRAATTKIARRSAVDPAELVLRFGLHWGSTIYVGLIKSIARSEVTAMGDEVNEAARIEACATGGRTLASKSLIERLDRHDAMDLAIESVSYSLLGELDHATEKSRRDASMIPVCEI